MSITSDKSKSGKWSHEEIVTGPRGANCQSCGCFIYSQTNDYKWRDNYLTTLSLPLEEMVRDVLPFEYYDALLKEEKADSKNLFQNMPEQIYLIRK